MKAQTRQAREEAQLPGLVARGACSFGLSLCSTDRSFFPPMAHMRPSHFLFSSTHPFCAANKPPAHVLNFHLFFFSFCSPQLQPMRQPGNAIPTIKPAPDFCTPAHPRAPAWTSFFPCTLFPPHASLQQHAPSQLLPQQRTPLHRPQLLPSDVHAHSRQLCNP